MYIIGSTTSYFTKRSSSATDCVLPVADEDRLEQVFINLLDNEFRYCRANDLISIRTERSDNDWLWIYVEDQGQWIPSEDLPYIFERFYKADKARKHTVSNGTGIRLAIVYYTRIWDRSFSFTFV